MTLRASHAATATSVAVLAFSLVACGGRDDVTSASPTAGKTDPVDPPARHGQALPTTVLPRLTAEKARHLTSTSWGLQGVRGRDVFIGYEIGGGCDTDRGVYVEETPARVLIGHYVHDTSAHEACTDEMKLGAGVIHLDSPLGSRALVHVVVGVSW